VYAILTSPVFWPVERAAPRALAGPIFGSRTVRRHVLQQV